MSVKLVTLDIPGIDLPLGGGLWTLERIPGTPASTTVLIRGAPGSGKTVFGCQLAGAVARSLGADVAYGCVELLPVELQAQHAGLRREGLQEEVLVPPFKSSERSSQQSARIFAGLLDLGASGEEQAQLGPALHALLTEVERVGGHPRVLVIDSLSDGYNLGSSAPRLLADSLCKMAVERGLVLILLEEVVEARPSAWSFAVDVVFELSWFEKDRSNSMTPLSERRMDIVKNRFSPSHAGPHRFSLLPRQGLRILPHPAAYLEPWAVKQLWGDWCTRQPEAQDWPPLSTNKPGLPLPPLRESVVIVHGIKLQAVHHAAKRFGRQHQSGASAVEIFLSLDFSRPSESELRHHSLNVNTGNLYISAHWLVAAVREVLEQVRRLDRPVSVALIGDLQFLRNFQSPEELRGAIGVIVAMLRQTKTPVVLFETTESLEIQPQAIDLADMRVSANSGGLNSSRMQLFRAWPNAEWYVDLA